MHNLFILMGVFLGYILTLIWFHSIPIVIPAIFLIVSLVGLYFNRNPFGLAAALISVGWVVLITVFDFSYWLASIFSTQTELAFNPIVFSRYTGLIIVGICIVVTILIAQKVQLKQEDMCMPSKWTSLLEKLGIRSIQNPYPVTICKDIETKKPVEIKYLDRFLHTLVIGPTGVGKTSRELKPMVYQDLQRIAAGKKLGLTLIEPKGDFAEDVAKMCDEMGIPCIYIDPEKPDTKKLNIMQGEAVNVAESTRTVLRGMFGKQEAFFAQVQETAARNTILMLKELRGDNLDLMDVVRALRNPRDLKALVGALEAKTGNTDLVQYFKTEVLGELRDKFQQFAMGLRQQLEDIAGNELLKRVLCGNSDINLDKHLSEGGVFIVSTAMGPLGRLGDIFGQFVIMHLQNAVFRRPGTEWTRTPHVLYIDEFPRYVNPDFERLLAIGRSYRCACVLALQTLDQLKLDGKKEFADIVLSNARNKIIFGGLNGEEARKFEMDFGETEVTDEKYTYKHHPIVPALFPNRRQESKKLEPRFSSTQIQDLKNPYIIYRIVQDGTLQLPAIGIAERIGEKSRLKVVRDTALDQFKKRFIKGGDTQEDAAVEKQLANKEESNIQVDTKEDIQKEDQSEHTFKNTAQDNSIPDVKQEENKGDYEQSNPPDNFWGF